MKQENESGSHQAPMLKGYASAWRQQTQLSVYGVSKLNSGNYLIKATTQGQHYYLHKLNITQ
jgi:hypothetical protein